MKLVIRADADVRTGTGHIMRCIALSQAWQDMGGDVIFLSHCSIESLRHRITNEGFDFIPMSKPYPDPYDVYFILDVLDQLKSQNPKNHICVLADGYHFTPDYQRSIRENGYRLLVIDDVGHLDHYHADILLNQNIYASNIDYAHDSDTVKLLGCEYVLLRREFLEYKQWNREIPEKGKKILITMGGSDPNNVTLKIISQLNRLKDSDIEVKIIAGPVNQNTRSFQKAIHHLAFAAHVLHNADNMPELMAWADVAVSAAGSTCWELAFMGVPSVTVVTFENQLKVAMEMERMKIFKTVGWYNEMNRDMLLTELTKLIHDKKLRENKCRKGRLLIDGEGAKKVADTMANSVL